MTTPKALGAASSASISVLWSVVAVISTCWRIVAK